jgi:hypothetical protein
MSKSDKKLRQKQEEMLKMFRLVALVITILDKETENDIGRYFVNFIFIGLNKGDIDLEDFKTAIAFTNTTCMGKGNVDEDDTEMIKSRVLGFMEFLLLNAIPSIPYIHSLDNITGMALYERAQNYYQKKLDYVIETAKELAIENSKKH